MKWNLDENNPPIAGIGARIYVNGQEVPYVVAFDTEGGWVSARCTDGHTGFPGQRHVDPKHPDYACMTTICGEVTVRLPWYDQYREKERAMDTAGALDEPAAWPYR